MGKNQTKLKPYIIISGLNLNDNNRGTAALGYGSLSFLYQKGLISNQDSLVSFIFYHSWRQWLKKDATRIVDNGEIRISQQIVWVFTLEKYLATEFGIVIPFTKFGRYINRIRYVAAINGGDGFSDIYGTRLFYSRLKETRIAMRLNIPLIELPQTIGPFKDPQNKALGDSILKYAQKVYVRDNRYLEELKTIGANYELAKDLSYYMAPSPFEIEIKSGAIGLNVSGLAYNNNFKDLAGHFPTYRYLISRLIDYFQKQGNPIYLIPHSYNFSKPEKDNDDLDAARSVYDKLDDKSNVYLVDRDLVSPQVKYLISQMSFFIGSRMHANFAAIYCRVPLFGLSYSYKFQGAFEANGIYNSTHMVLDIDENECNEIVEEIAAKYKTTCSLQYE